jgi:hypothetical protein
MKSFRELVLEKKNIYKYTTSAGKKIDVEFTYEKDTVWFKFKNLEGVMSDEIVVKFGPKYGAKTPEEAIFNWLKSTSMR